MSLNKSGISIKIVGYLVNKTMRTNLQKNRNNLHLIIWLCELSQ